MTEVKLATRPYGLPIRVLLPALLTLLLPGPPCTAEEREAAALACFEQRIRPLLIERCHKCHGASKQRSKLRLDSLHAALRGGESGPAIVPGSPEKSRLIHAVQYREKPRMPPKKKLSDREIADLVSWGAIGARTTESQVHRELASGLSMPVGFKNGTGGSVQIAIDAVQAARDAHHFLSVTKQGISAIVSTSGNDYCHVILRGSSRGINYDRESVQSLAGSLAEAGVHRRVMVDCSHGNSRKGHRRQSAVAREVGDQLAAGSSDIFGVMLESHLVEGRQDLVEGEASMYGQSVTDACISWEATETVLAELAEAVERGRGV